MSLKSLFSAKDMTIGSPWKRIMEFSIPLLLGNLAQQLYNTADSIIVGMYVGDNALAAVGSASPILNLLLALFVGIATGAGIVVSQSFGARDREGLSNAIGNCILLSVAATAFIMAVGPIVTMPMLTMLGTPDSIIDWCAQYLNIYYLGIAGFFFYNMFACILRALGDSVSALGFLLLAAALNVVLDLWFVQEMGVAGVSLATVLAQGISAVFCYIKLARMGDLFDLNLNSLKPRSAMVMRILRVGIPSGVTQAIMAAASMVVLNLTNAMGETVIACNVIIMRVDGFAMMPNFTRTGHVRLHRPECGRTEVRPRDGWREAGRSDCGGIFYLYYHCFALLRTYSLWILYGNRGADRPCHPYDPAYGGRIYLHFRHAGAGWCDARRR